MTMLHSHQDRAGRDAYRSRLINRNLSPAVYRAGETHLERLRGLARKFSNRAGAVLEAVHRAIIAAKMRRVQRELMFHSGSHGEWPGPEAKWREVHGLEKDAGDFPQTPMLLGDKWDS